MSSVKAKFNSSEAATKFWTTFSDSIFSNNSVQLSAVSCEVQRVGVYKGEELLLTLPLGTDLNYDDQQYAYLTSRNGKTISDKVELHLLPSLHSKFKKYAWQYRGSDERQYCSPGIDLPIASIMRTKYGEYPEYHTSLDDLINVVTESGLEGGFKAIQAALLLLEKNKTYQITTLCEPQMGKRGLYPNISRKGSAKNTELLMNFLSKCDGTKDLLSIAEEIECAAWDLYEIANKLLEHELISDVSSHDTGV